MSSGGERSPISLGSDSDTSRNRGHPLDAVIQKAIHRQQSPANVTSAPVNAGKRKRDPTPPDVDVISLHSTSSEDDTYGSDRDDAENGNSDIPLGPTKTASVAPIGVTVVEEGANTRNAEVQRLLRRGRQVSTCSNLLTDLAKKSASCSHFIMQTLCDNIWTTTHHQLFNRQPCSGVIDTSSSSGIPNLYSLAYALCMQEQRTQTTLMPLLSIISERNMSGLVKFFAGTLMTM